MAIREFVLTSITTIYITQNQTGGLGTLISILFSRHYFFYRDIKDNPVNRILRYSESNFAFDGNLFVNGQLAVHWW